MGVFDFKGLGRILAMLATALFVRAITGVGPALPPPEDEEEYSGDEESRGEYSGKVAPVTIRWTSITCYLSDKRGKTVSLPPS